MDETNNSTDFTKKFDYEVPLRSDISRKDRFKVLLQRKGISQNRLADLVGISKGTMSAVVNGQWNPTSHVMLLIGKILEVDSVILFGDSKYWIEWRDKIQYPKGGKEK